MRQFLLPRGWDGSSRALIGGKEGKRLSAVLRLRPGDAFPAMSADGGRYRCTVVSLGQAGVTVDVAPAGAEEGMAGSAPLPDVRSGSAESRQASGPAAPAPALPRIVLAVGALKGSKLDEVARAAAEAGVAELVPLYTERSVPRGDLSSRLERLRRIVDEALGQSGSPVATRVREPMGLAELADAWPARPGRLLLAFHETPLAEMTLHRYCSSEPDEIVACVGPEGGFSDAELGALAERGFGAAWLGPNVLRAETAAVFALASLRIVCLERSSWSMKK